MIIVFTHRFVPLALGSSHCPEQYLARDPRRGRSNSPRPPYFPQTITNKSQTHTNNLQQLNKSKQVAKSYNPHCTVRSGMLTRPGSTCRMVCPKICKQCQQMSTKCQQSRTTRWESGVRNGKSLTVSVTHCLPRALRHASNFRCTIIGRGRGKTRLFCQSCYVYVISKMFNADLLLFFLAGVPFIF